MCERAVCVVAMMLSAELAATVNHLRPNPNQRLMNLFSINLDDSSNSEEASEAIYF
jgi:hypothetical protein